VSAFLLKEKADCYV